MSAEEPNSPEPAEAAAQAPQAPVEQPPVAPAEPVAAEAPYVPPAPDPAPEPTPTVGTAEASFGAPAGSAAFGGTTAAVDPHPEKLVGAAFAGGLVGALFLKALAKRRHR
jgi:hypothetical protein